MFNSQLDPISAQFANIPNSIALGTQQGQQKAMNQQILQNNQETQDQNRQIFEENRQTSAMKQLMDEQTMESNKRQQAFTDLKNVTEIFTPIIKSAAKKGQEELDKTYNTLSQNPIIKSAFEKIGLDPKDIQFFVSSDGKVSPGVKTLVTPQVAKEVEESTGVPPAGKYIYKKLDGKGNVEWESKVEEHDPLTYEQQLNIASAKGAINVNNQVEGYKAKKEYDKQLNIENEFAKVPTVKKATDSRNYISDAIQHFKMGTNADDAQGKDILLKGAAGRISLPVYRDLMGDADLGTKIYRATQKAIGGKNLTPQDRKMIVKGAEAQLRYQNNVIKKEINNFSNRADTYKMSKDEIIQRLNGSVGLNNSQSSESYKVGEVKSVFHNGKPIKVKRNANGKWTQI